MAKLNLKGAVQSGINCELPRARYSLRGLKQTFGKSSSDNPMITWKTEIIAGPDGSEIIEHNGKKIDIGGYPVTYFITFSEKNLANCRDFFVKMGREDIANMEDFDPENPPDMSWLESVTFDAVLEAVPRIVRGRSMVKGKLGDPLLDKDGKEIVNGFEVKANLGDILGLSSLTTNRPY